MRFAPLQEYLFSVFGITNQGFHSRVPPDGFSVVFIFQGLITDALKLVKTSSLKSGKKYLIIAIRIGILITYLTTTQIVPRTSQSPSDTYSSFRRRGAQLVSFQHPIVIRIFSVESGFPD